MTRYLVETVALLGLMWFSTQAYRAHYVRPATNSVSIEQMQQAEYVR